MKTTRVAINGFGRIGRAFFKIAKNRKEIEIVAINDLGDLENLAYLLRYDTAYGKSDFDIVVKEGKLVVDGKEVIFLSEREPSKLPWGDLDIDIVLESTGIFTSYEKSKVHLEAGAKRVVVSAPIKDNPEDAGVSGSTVLMGVNEEALAVCQISSNASCTTNAGSPVMQILHEALGIEKALLSTVHGYTATQKIVDSPDQKDFRKGRAAAQNIIPGTTGAAIATTKVIKDLEGKFDGIAMRVPIVVGSIADITFVSKRDTSAEEVNAILKKAAGEKRWEKVFAVTEEPLVSSDIIGNPHASIADLAFTRVVGGNLVKVVAWYDNEMGYTHSLVEHVIASGKHI
ncbi:MAG: type I glyceraldehyde-3-phosphate dehydrogenase [Patescibacteria group bacterium]|nr:type I glyceraldehyde-3-phosphate dehydrogenase [Patescibacteria group bacterium]